MIVISGSCIKFDKEREKIMGYIGELEWGVHTKSNCECSSNGSALGWDFFQLYFDPEFVERLLEVHPTYEKKREIWLNSNLYSGFQNSLRKEI